MRFVSPPLQAVITATAATTIRIAGMTVNASIAPTRLGWIIDARLNPDVYGTK